jgi:hypothetical protein
MESSVTHASVNAAAEKAHPGWALVLALLSIPGSTIAWDLPAGGYWIGLPLGVAAIALGVQARQRGSSGRGKALAAIVIAGLMIAQMAVWTIVSALD